MLSIFKRNQSKSSNHKSKPSTTSLESKRDGIREKKALEGADRELFQYDQPKQELGMSDLIKNHESGTRFMYAALTGKESEAMESKLRRLVSFQPKLNKKSIPIDNLPVIRLYKETEIFPLDQILPKSGSKRQTEYGDYVRISDAIVMYGAVVSPDCNFTKIQIGITDNRLLTDQLVKSFTATTNIMSKGNLSLPYSIPKEDADVLSLTVSRERSFLEEGRQWGAIQIQLIVEFMKFPMQYENQAVAAINMLPPSALEKNVNNPNNIDISILNNDRDNLIDLYLAGDVADETEPIKNKTEVTRYSKSTISGASKGKKIEAMTNDWSFMNDRRVGRIPEDQNSIDPDETGSMKSISVSKSDDDESDENVVEPSHLQKKILMNKDSDKPTHKKTVSFGDEVSNSRRITNF